MKHPLLLFAVVLTLCVSCGSPSSRTKGSSISIDIPNAGDFTVLVANPVTEVKDQEQTDNCWCYSALSFLESEAIRKGGLAKEDYPDFSEMYLVSHSLRERAQKYVRLKGYLRLWSGSEPDDVLFHLVPDHGLVPQEVMDGWPRGGERIHEPLYAEVKALADSVMAVKGLTPADWLPTLDSILAAWLGPRPESFEWKGRTWTPAEYRDSFGLNENEYITFASFLHHPFYTAFPIEVHDNWRSDAVWNLPLDEFVAVLRDALGNGYTATCTADISEPGHDRQQRIFRVDTAPTQESRQTGFDNQSTTDDHAMHVFGLAEDAAGEPFFLIKDSYGPGGKGGYAFMSEPYLRAKCLTITLPRCAVPSSILRKLKE